MEEQKELDKVIEECCDAYSNELVMVRQNNVIIQLLFEIKQEIKKLSKK